MLKVLAVLLWISTGLAVIVAYDVSDKLIESDSAAPVSFAILLWPMFPIADGLKRMGVGDHD